MNAGMRTAIKGAVIIALHLPMMVEMANAAPVPWNKQAVSYVSERRPVRQVVRDVLATQSFPVLVTGDIRGEVTGQFNEPADRVISKLAAAYGFVWFFDGSILYVSPGTDIRSEVVELGSLDPSRVPAILSALGLLEERFPVRVSRGSALVSGPSRYVDLVVKALRAGAQSSASGGSGSRTDQPRRQEPAVAAPVNRRIRVYQLTHAQAGDVVRDVDGRRETMLGIASLLRGLARTGDIPRLDEQHEPAAADPDGSFSERIIDVRSGSRGQDAGIVRPAFGHDEAIIEADIRTNSVIVNASKEVLDYYGEVIQRLDLPRQLVQIDVTILNVASSDVRDIGVALGAAAQPAPSPRHPARFTEPPPGLLFEGILGSGSHNISVRVAALEQMGRVKVLSRPRLVGLENLQAVLGSRVTAHVRVAGAYQTDLYPVRAGLQLKVVPRVVSKQGDPVTFLLALDIVDGNLQQSVTVDGIPVSNEVAIATQAVVGEGQTLLIGGHQQENIGREHSGVPGLSRVPLVGGLFRRRRENHDLTEQLFLITPRLLPGGGPQGEAAAGESSSVPPDAPTGNERRSRGK